MISQSKEKMFVSHEITSIRKHVNRRQYKFITVVSKTHLLWVTLANCINIPKVTDI